jgi:hypothetical protein
VKEVYSTNVFGEIYPVQSVGYSPFSGRISIVVEAKMLIFFPSICLTLL